MSSHSWTLTDVERDIWLDSILLTDNDLGLPNCTVTKRTLRGGLRDGVDVVTVDNGAFSFTVVPTRGMGIWRGDFRGTGLGWQSPVRGPVHPKFVNELGRGNLGWLYGFDEWIVRCGLDSHGAPGDDTVVDNNGNPMTTNLTLHGRIANLPAHYVEVSSDRTAGTVSVTGHVDEVALFCPGLRLKSTITTSPGSNSFTIVDEVENLKSTPSELELLYHCNFGRPLLEAGSRLVAPVAEVAPNNARSTEGIDHFDTYGEPESGFVEQVYFYDLAAREGDKTFAALVNAAEDRAAVLRFSKSQLPGFTQWKNTGAESDGYVTGLEPSTDLPNLKTFERQQNRLVTIAPGASYRVELSIEILDTVDQVAALKEEAGNLTGSSPNIHTDPIAKWSPV